MPKHFTPNAASEADKATARQDLISTLVKDFGIGYGDAQSIVDTSEHAVAEAYQTMMTIVDRSSAMLGLGGGQRAVLAMLTMRMMGATADKAMASTVEIATAELARRGG